MSIPYVERELAVPSITFGDDPRQARLAHEHKALTTSVLNIVSSRSELGALGPDPLVRQILLSKGFTRYDFVALLILCASRLLTVIAVPTRVWRDPEARRAILQAKTEAKEVRSRCILVPQRCIRNNVRAKVARTLALSSGVKFEAAQAAPVLAYLVSHRIATLRECSKLVPDHPDPYGVVLSLCGRGKILIDRRSPIGPESIVAVGS
jgi:hypothetical protein